MILQNPPVVLLRVRFRGLLRGYARAPSRR
jgi:hypothetical protein